jgi:hypothetical protein
MEANYRQLLDRRPAIAVLPWGATEAHNLHLPHGTDVIEARAIAEAAADQAVARDARPIVLPAVPFGNNAQQQDQVATIHISTTTTLSLRKRACLSSSSTFGDCVLMQPRVSSKNQETTPVSWRPHCSCTSARNWWPCDKLGQAGQTPGSLQPYDSPACGRRGRGPACIPTLVAATLQPPVRRRARNTSRRSRRQSLT